MTLYSSIDKVKKISREKKIKLDINNESIFDDTKNKMIEIEVDDSLDNESSDWKYVLQNVLINVKPDTFEQLIQRLL